MLTRIAPLAAIALTACGPDDVRNVGDYDAVDNRTEAEMRYVDRDDSDDDPETILIDCSDDVAADVEIQTQGQIFDDKSTVVITSEGNADLSSCQLTLDPAELEYIRVTGDGSLVVDADANNLELVDVRGSGSVTIDGITNDFFRLDSAGSGELTVSNLVTDELVVDMTGTSEATFSGSASAATIDLTGTSYLDAKDLVIGDLTIEMGGTADADVTVEGELNADLRGDAELDVWGEADLGVIIEDGSSSLNLMD